MAKSRIPNDNELKTLESAFRTESELVRVIKNAAENEGIPREFIEFPDIITAKTDDEGRVFVNDLNNVVRYYLDEGVLTKTEEFSEMETVVSQNQQSATTLDRMVME